jgi:hypothetical protein
MLEHEVLRGEIDRSRSEHGGRWRVLVSYASGWRRTFAIVGVRG